VLEIQKEKKRGAFLYLYLRQKEKIALYSLALGGKEGKKKEV